MFKSALTNPIKQRGSRVPIYLLLPLGAALFYALGSIIVKRSLREGVSMEQAFHISNLILGIVFFPLLFLETKEVDWGNCWKPLALAAVFLVATWLTFLSLKKGDVTLVTPLMGTKVVFVAVGVTLLTSREPSAALWVAAVMTAIGIFVMGLGDIKGGRHVAFTILVTLLSAACYGLYDVLLSSWGPEFGIMAFLSLSCLDVSLGTLAVWVLQGRPSLKVKSPGAKGIWWGASLIALQALILGLALGFFNDATGINVMYASRGLWVIVLVVLLGGALGNQEHQQSSGAFLWRIVGTLVLTTAIVIAVIDRSQVG